jgi:Flp pilus assembly protein TadB
MLLLMFDLLILCSVVMVVAYLFNRFVKANREQKLTDALERQETAEAQLKIAQKLSPADIKANEKEVQDTLNKLQ